MDWVRRPQSPCGLAARCCLQPVVEPWVSCLPSLLAAAPSILLRGLDSNLVRLGEEPQRQDS